MGVDGGVDHAPVTRDWAEPRVLLKLGLVLAAFALLATVAGFTTPQVTIDPAGRTVAHHGWFSLLPALVAIVLAFTTRQVILALFLGIATGGVVYAFGSGVAFWEAGFPWSRMNIVTSFFLPQLGTPSFAIILVVYLWCLGGLIGIWGRTGGALHFAHWVGRHLVVGRRSAKFFTWFLGVVFHQGGTISTLLAGTTARPLLDENRVAKEEGAYIVNSTASPIAVLLPFNAWPLVAGAAIAGSVPMFTAADGSPDLARATTFFFEAIPFFFYAIFSVLFTLLLSLNILPAFFGLGRARRRVDETGDIIRPGSEPLQSQELTHVEVHPGYRTGLADFFLPLGFLIAVAVVPFLIRYNMGVEGASPYIAEAFFLALFVGILVALVKGMPIKVVLAGFVDGAKGVTMAAIILALAFTIKGVSDALGTGFFMADLLGDVLQPAFVPLLLMVTAMLVAFSTGTSFGTFSVMFPIAMPLAYAVLPGNETILLLTFGAVVSGSVFGDQASPISDTAILSSLAVGCDLMDHVTTQFPYAIAAAGLSGVLYVLLGLTLL